MQCTTFICNPMVIKFTHINYKIIPHVSQFAGNLHHCLQCEVLIPSIYGRVRKKLNIS